MIISPPVTLFRRPMGTHFVISVVPVKDRDCLTITYSTVNLHTLLSLMQQQLVVFPQRNGRSEVAVFIEVDFIYCTKERGSILFMSLPRTG